MTQLVEEWWLVRDEVKQLLFNRYVFGTLQEIVRRNPRLQGPVRGKFSDWSQVVYNVAHGVAVRRLAGDYQRGDVSLVGWLDTACRTPPPLWLWENFRKHFPKDVEAARNAVRSGKSAKLVDEEAYRRLLNQDRKLIINAAAPVIPFASKRAAHHNRTTKVGTKVFHMERAIEEIRHIAEKYDLLIFDKRTDLLVEVKARRLPKGWDQIFLEPWATEEILSLPLGEMKPPMEPPRD